MAKIATFNQKGGAGKTTIAESVGSAYPPGQAPLATDMRIRKGICPLSPALPSAMRRTASTASTTPRNSSPT
jgi:hypothetical protein